MVRLHGVTDYKVSELSGSREPNFGLILGVEHEFAPIERVVETAQGIRSIRATPHDGGHGSILHARESGLSRKLST